jgi:serine kinase of HPr protein (carbohydrate metabolism regulator)
MRRVNVHATALVFAGRGLLIQGPSGAGKSSLALAMLDLCAPQRVFGRLVCDDRVWLTAASGRLLAEAPETIAGLVEVRGFGPAPQPYEGRAVIDAVVRLVEASAAPRHREQAQETFLGVRLPRLDLAARDPQASARAAARWLLSL